VAVARKGIPNSRCGLRADNSHEQEAALKRRLLWRRASLALCRGQIGTGQLIEQGQAAQEMFAGIAAPI
jgi:hypothetical protein